MIDKFARIRERQENWPDYKKVAQLVTLGMTEHAETRIEANIRLVKLHQAAMRDPIAIARAERTIAQLERQLKHQLAVEKQRAALHAWRTL